MFKLFYNTTELMMNQVKLKELFDNQAANYDLQWEKTAPMRNGLLFLLEFVFAELPENARILCVGPGTGEEIVYLAKHFPNWSFTAVEPSGAMLDQFRFKAEKEGFLSRCQIHEGYLNSLKNDFKFDGATCFLVSQFIMDKKKRIEFFSEIAALLKPEGILASSDITTDTNSVEYEEILRVWFRILSAGSMAEDRLKKMRTVFAEDVAVLPPNEVEDILKSAGFKSPVRFYQTGLIHAWFSKSSQQ